MRKTGFGYEPACGSTQIVTVDPHITTRRGASIEGGAKKRSGGCRGSDLHFWVTGTT